MTWQANENYVEALRQATGIAGDLGKFHNLTPGSIGSGIRITAIEDQIDLLSRTMLLLRCADTEAAFAKREEKDA